MKTVRLRNVELGDGDSKIIVPITGETEEKIIAQAKELNQEICDLAEWRVDLFEKHHAFSEIVEVAKKLRDALGDMPFIFTIRTKEDGGKFEGTNEEYAETVSKFLLEGECDACDIELSKGKPLVQKLLEDAKGCGVKTIVSSHSFDKTPTVDKMISILGEMQSCGADIAKLAVMPKSIQDVLNLMLASAKAFENLNIPLITMSMGKLGAFSRVAGLLTGSCATFGSYGQESAPGQYDCRDLKKSWGCCINNKGALKKSRFSLGVGAEQCGRFATGFVRHFFNFETWKPVFSNAVSGIIYSNGASRLFYGQKPFFEIRP